MAEGAALGPRLVVVLGALSAFGPLTTDVYLPALPGLGDAFGASPSEVQLTLTACVIGLAVGQLLLGPLSDMLGRRLPLLVSLAVFAVVSLGCAAAPSLPVLIGARLAQGLAGAGGIVIARAMVRDLSSGLAAARAFSALMAIVTAGPVFAPLLGAGLLLFTEWRGVFVALAAIGVGLFLIALLATRETLDPSRRRPGALRRSFRDVAQLVRHRHFIAYALAGSLGFAGLFSYIAASSFVYQDVFGLSAQLYALLFAVNGVVLMSTNVANRRLVGQVEPQRLMLIGLSVICLAGLAIATATVAGARAGVVLPLLPLVAVGSGLSIPNSLALGMEREGERAGTASALFGLLQFSLGALVAPLVGIAGASAVPMGIAIAASALLALATFLLLAPDPRS